MVEQDLSDTEISKQLSGGSRTVRTIEWQRYQLGLEKFHRGPAGTRNDRDPNKPNVGWTSEEITDVMDLLESCNSRRDVASRLGRSHGSLDYIMARNGLRSKSPVNRWTEEAIERLRNLRESSSSLEELAQIFGKSQSTISRICSKLGISKSKSSTVMNKRC